MSAGRKSVPQGESPRIDSLHMVYFHFDKQDLRLKLMFNIYKDLFKSGQCSSLVINQR